MMKHQWLYLSLFLVGVAIIAVIAFSINGCQETQERNVDPSDVPELPLGNAMKSDFRDFTRAQFDSACKAEAIPNQFRTWMSSSVKDFETRETKTTYMLYRAQTKTTYILRLDLTKEDTVFVWEKRMKIIKKDF